MNTPSPLVPQGSLPHPSRGKSTVRIAVFTIVAIHAVFFAGLLMQGCKRDDANKSGSTTKSDIGSQSSDLAKLDTNYYQPLPESPVSTNAAVATATNPATGYSAAGPSAPLLTSPVPAEPSPAALPVETKEYVIARNDTLAKIAKTQHLTVGEITKANPGLDPKKLIPGKKIQVPVSTRTASNGGTAAGGLGFAEPSKPEAGAASKRAIHEVKAGETLTKIAKQHGVTIKALKTANGLKTDRVHVGQKLKLPTSSSATATATAPNEPAIIPGSPTTTLSATNPAGNTTVR